MSGERWQLRRVRDANASGLTRGRWRPRTADRPTLACTLCRVAAGPHEPGDTTRASSSGHEGRSRRAASVAGPVLVVLSLIAIVAVAAGGTTPSGSGQTQPADGLLDVVFSLVVVALVIGAAIVVYAFAHWRELEWSEPRRRYGIRTLVAFLAFAFALILFVQLRGDLRLVFDPEPTPLDRSEGDPRPPRLDAGSDPGYEFTFAWLPVVSVVALAAIGAAAFVLSARRRRRSHPEASLAAELAFAVDVTLDDLRAESDPRRAVIAAYARLERVLAAHGQPRRAADTPEEHVSRALAHLDVDRGTVRRLEDLFLRAKFSQHEIDARMKDDAIAALEQVRDDLRAPDAVSGRAAGHAGVPA